MSLEGSLDSAGEYQREADRVSCHLYEPCPVCRKCKVKASHLYLACGRCEIPICRHSEAERTRTVRRETIQVSTEAGR